ADAELLHGALQQLEKTVDGGALDEDPRPGATVLARIPEDGDGRCSRGPHEVRVREDDVRRLAAQLERDALDGLRGELADPAADGRRARERDLRHVGVLDQALADDPPGAGDDV